MGLFSRSKSATPQASRPAPAQVDRVYFHVAGLGTAPMKLKLGPRSTLKTLFVHLPLQRYTPDPEAVAELRWQGAVLDPHTTPEQHGMRAGEVHQLQLRFQLPQREPSIAGTSPAATPCHDPAPCEAPACSQAPARDPTPTTPRRASLLGRGRPSASSSRPSRGDSPSRSDAPQQPMTRLESAAFSTADADDGQRGFRRSSTEVPRRGADVDDAGRAERTGPDGLHRGRGGEPGMGGGGGPRRDRGDALEAPRDSRRSDIEGGQGPGGSRSSSLYADDRRRQPAPRHHDPEHVGHRDSPPRHDPRGDTRSVSGGAASDHRGPTRLMVDRSDWVDPESHELLQAEAARLRQRLSASTAEIAELHAALETERAAAASLRRRHAAVQEEADRLASEQRAVPAVAAQSTTTGPDPAVEELRRTVKELRREAAEARQGTQRLEETLADMEAGDAGRTRRFADMQAALRSATNAAASAAQDASRWEGRCRELEAEVEARRLEVDRAVDRARRDEAEARLVAVADLEAAVLECNRVMVDRQKENDALRRALGGRSEPSLERPPQPHHMPHLTSVHPPMPASVPSSMPPPSLHHTPFGETPRRPAASSQPFPDGSTSPRVGRARLPRDPPPH